LILLVHHLFHLAFPGRATTVIGDNTIKKTNLFEDRAKSVTCYIKHLSFRLSIENHSRLISRLFWSRRTDYWPNEGFFVFFLVLQISSVPADMSLHAQS